MNTVCGQTLIIYRQMGAHGHMQDQVAPYVQTPDSAVHNYRGFTRGFQFSGSGNVLTSEPEMWTMFSTDLGCQQRLEIIHNAIQKLREKRNNNNSTIGYLANKE